MQHIGKLNKKHIGNYKYKIVTREVILTNERLNEHILIKHSNDYEILRIFLKDIVQSPDIVIEDNMYDSTLIFIKNIKQIDAIARIVVKLAVLEDKKHPLNSIITIMRLNKRTLRQTLANRGKIIFKNMDFDIF